MKLTQRCGQKSKFQNFEDHQRPHINLKKVLSIFVIAIASVGYSDLSSAALLLNQWQMTSSRGGSPEPEPGGIYVLEAKPLNSSNSQAALERWLASGQMKSSEDFLITVKVCDKAPPIVERVDAPHFCHSALEFKYSDSEIKKIINKFGPDQAFLYPRYQAWQRYFIERVKSPRLYDYYLDFRRLVAEGAKDLDPSTGYLINAAISQMTTMIQVARAQGKAIGYLDTMIKRNRVRLLADLSSHGYQEVRWALLSTAEERLDSESTGYIRSQASLSAAQLLDPRIQGPLIDIKRDLWAYLKRQPTDAEGFSVLINRTLRPLSVDIGNCEQVYGPGWRLPTDPEVWKAAPLIASSPIYPIIEGSWIATSTTMDPATERVVFNSEAVWMKAVHISDVKGSSGFSRERAHNLKGSPLWGEDRQYGHYHMDYHGGPKILAGLCICERKGSQTCDF